MEEKTINKTVRMNEIRKELAWISSEYVRMFSTDPKDLQMVADNDRLHCLVLSNQLSHLKAEIENNKYPATLIDELIIAKLQAKLIKVEMKDIQNLKEVEKSFFKGSFETNL